MPDELTFLMGKYEARFPTDRRYSRNHMWLKALDGRSNEFRVGFTAYSVRLLLDVYFLDWAVDAGTEVKAKQDIGEIESSKAVSTLYAPAEGRIIAFNEQLLADPSAINLDNYAAGWLYEFYTDDDLLSPDEYIQVLEAGWEDTQRMLKGQLNM